MSDRNSLRGIRNVGRKNKGALLAAAIAGAAGLAASASSTLAAAYTWDGGASNNNWASGDNWNPNIVGAPATGSNLVFDSGNNGYTTLNNDIPTPGPGVYSYADGSIANAYLRFLAGAPAYTINGNKVKINRAYNYNESSSNQLITLPFELANAVNFGNSNSSNSMELSGVISGGTTATLMAVKTGTLILSGDSTFSGTIDAGGDTTKGRIIEFRGSNSSAGTTNAKYGTLALNSSSNGGLASGPIYLSSSADTTMGHRLIALGADRTLTNNLFTSVEAGQTIGGSYSITFTAGSLSPSGNNLNYNLGNFITGAGKKLTLNNINIGHTSSTSAKSLTLRGTGTTVVNGTIANNNGYANNIITGKTGAGTNNEPSTVIFMSTNTYTGTTTVANGTLLVNGANTGTGAVSVANGAKLGGTGSIAGSVSLVSGATLSPGASIQSLATGALTLAGGSNLEYELDSAALPGVGADLTVVSGNLDLTSGLVKLNLSDLSAGTFGNGLTYTVVNYTGSLTGTGLFSVDNGVTGLADGGTFAFGGNTWTIDYNATSGGTNFSGDQLAGSFVNISTVPEPASVAGLLMAGSLLALRRKNRRLATGR